MRTVCWRVPTWSPDLASVRYRAVIPALHLASRGVTSTFSSHSSSALDSAPDAVVFAKAYGESDVGQAREAARAGIPVLLDVCDNVFAPGYQAHSPENMRSIAEVASAIVTTGEALADVLHGELGAGLRVEVVPDPIETEDDVRRAVKMLRSWQLRALRHGPSEAPRALVGSLRRLAPALLRSTSRHHESGLPQVLWFGNAGSVEPRFGVVNLADIGDQLVSAAREVPFRLLVVSSSRKAYRDYIQPLPLDTAYARWDRMLIFRHLRESAVVILPNSRDAFSICKSANRATLALSHGVPVVATRIPSLDPLAGCLIFDDFHTGVVTYLREHELAAEHVRQGGAVIEREFQPGVVAEGWLRILDKVRR